MSHDKKSIKTDKPTRREKFTLFAWMVTILGIAIYLPSLFRIIESEADKEKILLYDKQIEIANKQTDSAAKADFIEYATLASSDNELTYQEKLKVDAKYATLQAWVERNNIDSAVYTGSYANYTNKAQSLPANKERDEFLAFTSKIVESSAITKADDMAVRAKYLTLMSNQKYRMVSIKIKVKEWWQGL